MPTEGVRSVDGNDGVSFELVLDLRRFRPRKTLLMRVAVVTDPEDASVLVSLDEDDPSDELEESKTSCRSPGCDSSSITL